MMYLTKPIAFFLTFKAYPTVSKLPEKKNYEEL